jgi:hypothetical protein
MPKIIFRTCGQAGIRSSVSSGSVSKKVNLQQALSPIIIQMTDKIAYQLAKR